MPSSTDLATGFLARLADLPDTLVPDLAAWSWQVPGLPILGTGRGDLLAPPAGDDTSGFLILGLGGDDTARGGPRSDTILGGSGDDGIIGDWWHPVTGPQPSRGNNLIQGGA